MGDVKGAIALGRKKGISRLSVVAKHKVAV
jgi:hypothetical protein